MLSNPTNFKLYSLSINRAIVFFRNVGVVHLIFLIIDIYNGFSGIWSTQPHQFALFLNHIISIPVLFCFSQYLKNQIENGDLSYIRYKRLILYCCIVFFPIVITYHYVEINTTLSASALVIYILVFGLSLFLNDRLRLLLSLYFAVCYFMIPIVSGVQYADNPYLYMIGLSLIHI